MARTILPPTTPHSTEKAPPTCHMGKITRAASLHPSTSVAGCQGKVELILEKDINKLIEPKSLRLTLKGVMGARVKDSP